jgi:hypothetical protein
LRRQGQQQFNRCLLLEPVSYALDGAGGPNAEPQFTDRPSLFHRPRSFGAEGATLSTFITPSASSGRLGMRDPLVLCCPIGAEIRTPASVTSAASQR